MQSFIPYIFPQFGPCIAPRILDFSQNLAFSDAKLPTFCHIFGPTVPNLVGFSQDVPSSDARFHMFFHILAPLHQKMCLGFSQDFPSSDAKYPHSIFLAPLYQKLLGFHSAFLFWCKISHIFPHFGPYCAKNLSTFTGFFLFRCNIPTCAYKHTHTHTHGASRICKILQKFWPKTIFVCKAIFYIFKNKSARIYLCKAIFYIFGNYSPKQKFMYVIVLAGMVSLKKHFLGLAARSVKKVSKSPKWPEKKSKRLQNQCSATLFWHSGRRGSAFWDFLGISYIGIAIVTFFISCVWRGCRLQGLYNLSKICCKLRQDPQKRWCSRCQERKNCGPPTLYRAPKRKNRKMPCLRQKIDFWGAPLDPF